MNKGDKVYAIHAGSVHEGGAVREIHAKVDTAIFAGTGHRPPKLGNEWDGIGVYSDFLRHKIQETFIQYQPEYIISGLVLGFDMVLAEMAIANNLELIAAIPCKDQEKVWKESAQKRYNKILSYKKCQRHLVSNEKYFKGCMDIRNVWMVDQLIGEDDKLLAAYNGTKGGTHNCIEYAKSKGKEIIQIDLKLIISK